MDDAFAEWAQKTTQQVCVRQWAKQLIELGCSWDTFDRPEQDITTDFVNGGGIPLVAARDIVWAAKQEIQRRKAPLGIFWDMESMTIPEAASGRDITTRLQTVLATYGILVQFRAYARTGSSQMSKKKQKDRSDLQLSGCDLIDCPHEGRKEIVETMIMVDAMEFAYKNPEGATLCLITGDVDPHAYLLAKLQKPPWRTIVILKDSVSPMLHVNFDERMLWERDICMPLSLSTEDSVRNGADTRNVNDKSSKLEIEERETARENFARAAPSAGSNDKGTKEEEPSSGQTHSMTSPVSASEGSLATQEGSQQFFNLARSEEWKEDAEILLSLIKSQGGVGYKRTISNMLHSTNPDRFPNRRMIGSFLSEVIEAGLLVETGQGNYRELSIPYSGSSNGSGLKTSKVLPRYLKDMIVDKVGIYVARTYDTKWLILMFNSMSEVHRFDGETPHGLNGAVLADFNSINLDNDALVGTCCKCGEDLLESEVIYKIDGNRASEEGDTYCSKCYRFDNVTERRRAVSRVIDLLTVMAVNDDIYLPRKQVKKLLYERYRGVCTSHKHAEFWIDEAVSQDKVAPFKREGQKKMYLCLTFSLSVANGQHPPDDLDTSNEEKHVRKLLDAERDSAWIPRKTVNESLSTNFPTTMKSPLYRSKVFQNGHQKKIFFIARGPFGQTVGITEQSAQDSLEMMTKSVREEVTWSLNDNAASKEKTTSDVTRKLKGKESSATAFDSPQRTKVNSAPEKGRPDEVDRIQEASKSTLNKEPLPTNTRVEKESLEKAGKPTPLYSGGGNDDNLARTDVDDWEAESINSAEIDARLNLQLSFLDDE